MKEVILAKSAGFCFGVKRAVETVYQQIETGKAPIYTYGPIIHNEEVVADLERRGVRVLQPETPENPQKAAEPSELCKKREDTADTSEKLQESAACADQKKGTVVIRSHGISKAEYEWLKAQGYTCVDATCPFVKKIHRIVEEESKKGSHIVIIGTASHPEVQGICGWVQSSVTVIENEEEAREFAKNVPENICIISQTTFNNNKFKDLVEIIEEKSYNAKCVNTICNATEERQREARQIAAHVEAMVVIGGKSSSNTQKLFDICKEECPDTYYIQTLSDLDIRGMQQFDCIGITAGASTPKNIIEEVQKNVRREF